MSLAPGKKARWSLNNTTPDFKPSRTRQQFRDRVGEQSFSLVETVIALSLMAYLIIEMGGVQGNAISFAEYGRRVSEASWLAKRVMAEVEYNASFRPFKELDGASVKEQKFEDSPDYSFDVEIKDWKLNLATVLSGALAARQNDEDGDTGADGLGEIVKMALEQAVGEDAFKIAKVTVYWAEGAARNSTSLGTILTNQEKMDSTLAGLKGAWDQLQKASTGSTQSEKPVPGGGQPQPSPSVKPQPTPSSTTGGGP